MNEPAHSSENGMTAWELGLLAALALGLRLVRLDHPPHFDEMYHVLAARSWAADGTLVLGDGAYTRTPLFTVLIGGLFRLFGESLVVARLPALLAGTLSVVVLGRWTGAHAGRTAGWLAGLLLAADPAAIFLSQMARFYTLHGLLFLLAAAALFALVERGRARPWPWRLGVAGAVVLALAAALYLQVTTLIGLAGLLLWSGWRAGGWWWTVGRHHKGWRWAPLAPGIAAALWLAAGGWETAGELWRSFRTAPLWNSAPANEPRYYKWLLNDRHPVLFALFPAAVLIAWGAWRRFAAFCALVFGAALVLHSLAASKDDRYLAYAMPFFYAVSALGLAALLPGFRALVERAWGALLPGRAGPRARRVAAWTGIGLVALFAAVNTPALGFTRRLVLPGGSSYPFIGPNWPLAASALRPLADSVDAVVSSALPTTLYYLDRADIALSVSQLREAGGSRAAEFTRDPRTGRPVIGRAESLASLIRCHRTGLVIVEDGHWRQFHSVPDSVADLLERRTEPVPLAPASRIRAFHWRSDAAGDAASCAGLSTRPRPAGAEAP